MHNLAQDANDASAYVITLKLFAWFRYQALANDVTVAYRMMEEHCETRDWSRIIHGQSRTNCRVAWRKRPVEYMHVVLFSVYRNG